jgi:hypothetical protein
VADATLRAPSVDPFEAVVDPGDVFRHPREVLTYPGLTTAEKRIILASWASDVRALESRPTLRCLPGCRAEPVPLNAVLAALQALDEGAIDRPAARGNPRLPLTIGSRGNREAASWRNGFN